MQMVMYLSDFVFPFLVFWIVGYGAAKGRPVFEDFLAGAKRGVHTVVEIAPTVIGLMVMTAVLRAAGLFDVIARLLSPVTEWIHFPAPLLPLLLVRLFSSSAANGIVTDLFAAYGPDSPIGTAASILMGCTESVFYVLGIYYAAVRVTKTRYTLAGALISIAAGSAASLILATVIKL